MGAHTKVPVGRFSRVWRWLIPDPNFIGKEAGGCARKPKASRVRLPHSACESYENGLGGRMRFDSARGGTHLAGMVPGLRAAT